MSDKKNTYSLFYSSSDLEMDELSKFLDSCGLVPISLGHQNNGINAGCNNRISGEFEILYVVEGEAIVTIDHKHYPCSAGDITLIPPYAPNSIYVDKNKPHSNYWFHFNITNSSMQDQFLDLICPNNIYHIGTDNDLIKIYDDAISEYRSGHVNGKFLYLKSYLTQILIQTIRLHDRNYSIKERGMENVFIDKCVRYIYDNIYTQLTLKSLSEHFETTDAYISQAFAEVFDMPPMRFIQNSKIKYGALLLSTTEEPVKKIASDLGFSSQYHFSNVFKQYYGISPTVFKNNLGKYEEDEETE